MQRGHEPQKDVPLGARRLALSPGGSQQGEGVTWWRHHVSRSGPAVMIIRVVPVGSLPSGTHYTTVPTCSCGGHGTAQCPPTSAIEHFCDYTFFTSAYSIHSPASTSATVWTCSGSPGAPTGHRCGHPSVRQPESTQLQGRAPVVFPPPVTVGALLGYRWVSTAPPVLPMMHNVSCHNAPTTPSAHLGTEVVEQGVHLQAPHWEERLL